MLYLSIYLSIVFLWVISMNYFYSFPAVRGKQAKTEYYIAMVPCGLLSKLFDIDNNNISIEERAQRKLNYSRIPDIKDYILENRKTYIFSALTASIDGDFEFKEVGNSLGFLNISMNARFLINDGQHRNAALQEAIEEDSSLADETISIVFYKDEGLKRSQQMFTDLNKYAIKPSKSQSTYYDSKDKVSILCKEIINDNDFLRDYVDLENDSLGKYSAKLFTLSSFYQTMKYMLLNETIDYDVTNFCKEYWNLLTNNIYEWQLLVNKEITKMSLREEYIITQNIVLYALGKLGNFFLQNSCYEISEYLPKIKKINWLRTNKNWHGIAIINGKISTKSNNTTLTYIKIKELVSLPLTKQEKDLLRRK